MLIIYLNTVTLGSTNEWKIDLMDCNQIINYFNNANEFCEHIAKLLEDVLSNDFRNASNITYNESFIDLIEHIEKNYNEKLLLRDLCRDFNINYSYCCELFKKTKNMTFSEYLISLRMNKAAQMLEIDSKTIHEIANCVGYEDYFYFNKSFKKYHGCTPAAYRNIKTLISDEISS